MKYILIAAALIISCNAFGQIRYDTLILVDTIITPSKALDSAYFRSQMHFYDSSFYDGPIIHVRGNKKDSLICVERGHVMPQYVSMTAMACDSYIIDTDTTSVLVYPACNYYEYACKRCGEWVREMEEEERYILWEKPKE